MIFIYYLLSFIGYKSLKGQAKFIPLVGFVLFISLSRPANASVDARYYLQYIENRTLHWNATLEPTFSWISNTIQTLLPSIQPLDEFRIITLIPALLVFLITFKKRIPLAFLFYTSCEGFVLLSFNGIRQGLAQAFLLVSIILYSNIFVTSNKEKPIDFELVIDSIKKYKIYSILSFICLFLGINSHLSAYIYIAILFLYLILDSSKRTLYKLFSKLKINRYLIIILTILILLPINYNDTIIPLIDDASTKFLLYSISNRGFNSGPWGSIYRYTVLIAWTYISFKFINSMKLYSHASGNLNKKINLTISATIAPLIVMIPTSLIALGIFVRFSYFTYIPILISSMFITLYYRNTRNVLTKLEYISLFVGFISYNSGAVLTQLTL